MHRFAHAARAPQQMRNPALKGDATDAAPPRLVVWALRPRGGQELKLRFFAAVALAAITISAAAQPSAPVKPAAPISPALLDYFYTQVYNWDRGAPGGLRAIEEMEFLTKTRAQLARVGTGAFPIAPKVAELMATSEKNRYTIAYMVMGMSPAPADADLPALLAAASGIGAERLVAYAQLGRSTSPQALQALRSGARAADVPGRLMATVALAYMAKTFPDDVAQSIAANLKDEDKAIRSASANGLRLMGPAAQSVAPQLLEYFHANTANPYQAIAALKNFPLAMLRPYRADFEAVVADPKLNSVQKQDAVDLLVRMDTEK